MSKFFEITGMNGDIEQTCSDCGKAFTITEGEQEFYQSKDFPLPKRCKPCRMIRRKNIIKVSKKDYGYKGHSAFSHQSEEKPYK
jgi:ribosomal protein L36